MRAEIDSDSQPSFAKVPGFLSRQVCSSSSFGPQGSPQKRPTVVRAKPANGSGLGIGVFTSPSPVEARLFWCANFVDRIRVHGHDGGGDPKTFVTQNPKTVPRETRGKT